MADKYLYSKEPDGSYGKITGAKFLIGRVKSVVLGPYRGDGAQDVNYNTPKDIGKIYYEILYSNMNMSNAQSSIQAAYPIFGFLKQYPLIGEIVYVVPGPDSDLNDSVNRQGYWYFPSYNVWNSPQHGIFPNMQEYSNFVIDSNAKTASKRASNMVAIPAGRTFEEKKDIRTLRPFEGDTIIESRFGQSIRFGSTVVGAGRNQLKLNPWSNSGKNGSPILMIRNGQGVQESNDFFDTTVEDINKNDAAIWLTSDQEIIFDDLNQYPIASYTGISTIKQTVTKLDRQLANPEGKSAASTDTSVSSTYIIPQ